MTDLPDTDAMEKLLADATEIASERDEKCAESMMMAEMLRDAGHNANASGFDFAAEHARDTARVLRALATELIALRAENAALRKQVQAGDGERNQLRGLLWIAWKEANEIRARSGAPLGHDGMQMCAEKWWGDMTEMFALAIGDDAQTPWPSPEAMAVIAAYREAKA